MEITLKGYKCERCGHIWAPREVRDHPRVCPKCKSPYWDTPRRNPEDRIVDRLVGEARARKVR